MGVDERADANGDEIGVDRVWEDPLVEGRAFAFGQFAGPTADVVHRSAGEVRFELSGGGRSNFQAGDAVAEGSVEALRTSEEAGVTAVRGEVAVEVGAGVGD